MSVRAYEVTVRGRDDWHATVNARSAGAAKYQYLLDVRGPWPDVTFADLTVRSVGAPRGSDRLRRVAEYRRRPELVAGARVRVGQRVGFVVDADDSSNFVIDFGDGSRGHVHPGDIEVLEGAAALTGGAS